ncbi:MAG: hypothetical protein OEL83_16100 [Desulforhopalus sp.]|nr:hypothetical protein [Desulforhopalus sp.]
MGRWFQKNLGDAMLAFVELEHVELVCQSAYTKANCSEEMAVFLRHESEGRLHCEVVVYFSPAMAHIAGELGAIPCEQPTRYGLSLLVGTPDGWPQLLRKD